MRISDWSSDVCSSDLHRRRRIRPNATCVRAGSAVADPFVILRGRHHHILLVAGDDDETRLFAIEKILHRDARTSLAKHRAAEHLADRGLGLLDGFRNDDTLARRQTIGLDHDRRTAFGDVRQRRRSEEHTSELQSLMRISYAVFCLKKKIQSNSQKSQKTIKKIRQCTKL